MLPAGLLLVPVYMCECTTQCCQLGLSPSLCVGVLQAYYMLDEISIAGELQESSKKSIARVIAAQSMRDSHFQV